MKNILLTIFALLFSISGWSEPKDGVAWPLLTVTCDTSQNKLDIVVTYVDDIEGMHDPLHGRYDLQEMAHWEEIPDTPGPDYKTSVDTFTQKCMLAGEEFEVVITGHQFAGSPMQECGPAVSADVKILRGGRVFLGQTLLDDCFDHEGLPIQSINVDMKTRTFAVRRQKFIAG
jgi:hypothetical protein